MPATRVLVIEDEYLIALEIEALLQEAGIGEIVSVATESLALDEVRGGHWDAVIADANLNGTGINRIVAALFAGAIPFVIVSGYKREDLPPELADAPIVTKPFLGPELIWALAKIMYRRLSKRPVFVLK